MGGSWSDDLLSAALGCDQGPLLPQEWAWLELWASVPCLILQVLPVKFVPLSPVSFLVREVDWRVKYWIRVLSQGMSGNAYHLHFEILHSGLAELLFPQCEGLVWLESCWGLQIMLWEFQPAQKTMQPERQNSIYTQAGTQANALETSSNTS